MEEKREGYDTEFCKLSLIVLKLCILKQQVIITLHVNFYCYKCKQTEDIKQRKLDLAYQLYNLHVKVVSQVAFLLVNIFGLPAPSTIKFDR